MPGANRAAEAMAVCCAAGRRGEGQGTVRVPPVWTFFRSFEVSLSGWNAGASVSCRSPHR